MSLAQDLNEAQQWRIFREVSGSQASTPPIMRSHWMSWKRNHHWIQMTTSMQPWTVRINMKYIGFCVTVCFVASLPCLFQFGVLHPKITITNYSLIFSSSVSDDGYQDEILPRDEVQEVEIHDIVPSEAGAYMQVQSNTFSESNIFSCASMFSHTSEFQYGVIPI